MPATVARLSIDNTSQLSITLLAYVLLGLHFSAPDVFEDRQDPDRANPSSPCNTWQSRYPGLCR
jgi:hypothetical protein